MRVASIRLSNKWDRLPRLSAVDRVRNETSSTIPAKIATEATRPTLASYRDLEPWQGEPRPIGTIRLVRRLLGLVRVPRLLWVGSLGTSYVQTPGGSKKEILSILDYNTHVVSPTEP